MENPEPQVSPQDDQPEMSEQDKAKADEQNKIRAEMRKETESLFSDFNALVGKYHNLMSLGFLQELDALAVKHFPEGVPGKK